MRRLLPAIFLLYATACATTQGGYLDTGSLTVSDNSKIVSADLIPEPERYPRAVTHLALAEELYERKLALLRDRRVTVRERTRALQVSSFAVLAISAIGVGALSIANRDTAQTDGLRQGGYVALAGLAGGTLLQVLGNMQEDPASLDGKVARLQSGHAHLIEQLRAIATSVPPAGTAPGVNIGIEARMAMAIEVFMSEASQINVQG
jgi:hypothetical protein